MAHLCSEIGILYYFSGQHCGFLHYSKRFGIGLFLVFDQFINIPHEQFEECKEQLKHDFVLIDLFVDLQNDVDDNCIWIHDDMSAYKFEVIFPNSFIDVLQCFAESDIFEGLKHYQVDD